MSVRDFFKLLRRHLKLLICLPMVFALCCSAYYLLQPRTFSSTVTIFASDEAPAIGGIASLDARTKAREAVFSDYKLTVAADGNAQSVAVCVEGPDGAMCAATAEEIAQKAESEAISLHPDVVMKVSEPSGPTDISEDPSKYIASAFFLGLFVAVCIVLVVDLKMRRIHSGEDFGERTGLRPLVDDSAQVEPSGNSILTKLKYMAGHEKIIGVVSLGPASLPSTLFTIVAKSAPGLKFSTLFVDMSPAMDAHLGKLGDDAKSEAADIPQTAAEGPFPEIALQKINDYVSCLAIDVDAAFDSDILYDYLCHVQNNYDLILVNIPLDSERPIGLRLMHEIRIFIYVLKPFDSTVSAYLLAKNLSEIVGAKAIGFACLR